MNRKKVLVVGNVPRDKMPDFERREILANNIKLLFGFMKELIFPYEDILQESIDHLKHQADYALNAAPILGAQGVDYDLANKKSTAMLKRAQAIKDLVRILQETQKDLDYVEKHKGDQMKLRKAFGL